MKPFFADKERRENLLAIAKKWMGTPYMANKCEIGRGADCMLFIAAIYKELGILHKFEKVRVAHDWYNHSDRELIICSINQHIRHLDYGVHGMRVPEGRPLFFGDLLLFSLTKSGKSNHAGLYLGEKNEKCIIHSINRVGVSMNLGSYLMRRLTFAFRIYEVDNGS